MMRVELQRWRQAMKASILALVSALTVTPALAQTIAASEAQKHVGQSATVAGVVSEVHRTASGNAIFIDIGGRYPDNAFAAVIFADDFSKFPEVDSLDGKTVTVTGRIKDYQGKPEIILNDPGQIRTR
jgi:DNA/RNA endonuclease YhcR with UshA esterase domain